MHLCNLRIDPLDYSVMGLCWENKTYVDVSMAFGLKVGAAMCQMTTDAIKLGLHKKLLARIIFKLPYCILKKSFWILPCCKSGLNLIMKSTLVKFH